MTPYFTLANARTGTLYLRYLFQNNVPNCICRHEPFFDWGNPTLFGPAIYDAYAGRIERVRRRLEKKRAYIERQRGDYYLESSHAFLKSSYVAALDVFPDLRLIHLVRDPVSVARSQAWREYWRRRVHAPFHFYTGDDGRRHFAWALTGNEEIFQEIGGKTVETVLNVLDRDSTGLKPGANESAETGRTAPHASRITLRPADPSSLFAWYLLEWIEIENRALRFLDEHQLHDRCFTLLCPRDLNDPDRIRAMFDFFKLPTTGNIVLQGRKNRSIGYSAADRLADERAAAELFSAVPAKYLEIFRHPPYNLCAWAEVLRNACGTCVP